MSICCALEVNMYDDIIIVCIGTSTELRKVTGISHEHYGISNLKHATLLA